MDLVTSLTYNPFQENTIIVTNKDKECIIFDPGCYHSYEEKNMAKFIYENGLRPVRLINTHCHLDHIFGNAFVHAEYGLLPELHSGELEVLQRAPEVSATYGVPFPKPSPEPFAFLEEGDVITLGELSLVTIFTPGHSPASLCFYCESKGFLVGGDVLFRDSIGRTDLPGGDHKTLLKNIREKIFTLPDETVVYPGHGPQTTVGYEKKNNPFF